MVQVTAASGRILMGKFPYRADLLDALKAVASEQEIQLAAFSCIGAVEKAHVSYYSQTEKKYHSLYFDQPMEILSCQGNISLKEGTLIAHAHVVFGDAAGRAIGGHLMSGTILFACEYTFWEFPGVTLHRGFDETTGLPLWESVGKIT